MYNIHAQSVQNYSFTCLNVQSCDVLVVFVVLVAQAPKFICLAIEWREVKGDKASSTEIDLLCASVPLALENRFNLNCNKYCNNGRVSDILLCQNQIVALLLLTKARRQQKKLHLRTPKNQAQLLQWRRHRPCRQPHWLQLHRFQLHYLQLHCPQLRRFQPLTPLRMLSVE